VGFVVLTPGQYEAMEEPSYLFPNPANAKRLADGIRQAENGNTKTIDSDFA